MDTPRTSLLESWTRAEPTYEGRAYPTYRKGTGPGVVVIHEIPGLIPEVIAFGEEVVAAGFTVVMPHLFGRTEDEAKLPYIAETFAKVCVSKEFVTLHAGRTSPIASWLRGLARDLHAELGGPGVGALGMCFTGGFALAMMVDSPVEAPVLCQPSLPFPVTKGLGADVGLSPEDLAAVKARTEAGCQVMGLRFDKDVAVGTRFDTLTRELGQAFIRVEFPGRQHSTVTVHRQQEGVDRVLAFLHDKLDG